MNCLLLVLLLLCNQNNSGCNNDCGCGNSNSGCGNNGVGCNRNSGGCSNREREREENCRCSDSRIEPRTFIPYPGSTCGCEEPRNNNGCDCNQ